MTDPPETTNPRDVSLEGALALPSLGTATRARADADAFRRLYDGELAYVLRTLRRLGVRSADIEDVAHDVFVVVHRRWGDYDRSRPVKPWLFGIAYRVASDHRRRAHVRREIGTDAVEATCPQPSPETQAAATESRELLLAALEELDLPFRAAIVLHDLDGCTAPEIARVLEVPLNTVYSRVRLARDKLAAAIARRRGGAQ